MDVVQTSQKKDKVLLHMDGDAFFVGVEVAKNSNLKGKPVVTGQERGIVSALSYEAKALGIIRGMPIFKVKKLFPSVIIMSGDYKSYATYSSKMFDIVRRYADDVEEYSIDECFADLTGLEPLLKMSYLEIAQRIKKEINDELGLSVTIGMAPTKVLAKVASKWVKPNGLTVITKDTKREFLSKMSVDKIWGIGPRSAKKMIERGIITAEDFINKDIVWVRENFYKPYEAIWRELHGEMVMKINTETKDEYDSIQKTRTFHPSTNDKVFLLSQFSKNIEEACRKARHYDLTPKKLSLFLKDKDFNYTVSNVTLDVPTNTPEVLISIASGELDRMWKKGTLYRTTGVTLQELALHYKAQGNLFGNGDKADKFEAIHKELDYLESKLGKKLVHLGSTHNALEHYEGGTDMDDKDRNLLFL